MLDFRGGYRVKTSQIQLTCDARGPSQKKKRKKEKEKSVKTLQRKAKRCGFREQNDLELMICKIFPNETIFCERISNCIKF